MDRNERIVSRYHKDIYSKTMVTFELNVGKIGPEIGQKSFFSKKPIIIWDYKTSNQ